MNVLYIVALVILAIVVVFLLSKMFPIAKTIFIILFGLVLAGVTFYCGIELNKYYTAHGGIFGEISGYFDINKIESKNMKFNLSNIELKQVNENLYRAESSTNDIFKLKTNTKYSIFVNGLPCKTIDNASDFIMAEYKYNFYDENKNLLLQDTLSFKFAFNEYYSYLLIETEGGTEAVKYWNYYFNKNNFTVEIKESTYLQNEDLEYVEGETPDVCFVTYVVDDVESKVLISEGTKISEISYQPTKKYYLFAGWSLDGETILSSNYSIDSSTTLYAVFTQEGGLYDENGIMTSSWEQLISDDLIGVEGTVLKLTQHGSIYPEYLSGVLVVEDGITIIDEEALAYRNNLTKIYLPDSVTEIKDIAFEYCMNLEEIYLSENLKEIGTSAFSGCSKLKEINIPDSVTYISSRAFRNCVSLQSVKLSSNLQSLESIFSDCKSLKHVVVPSSVKYISSGTFEGCVSLQTVYIPDSVTTINTGKEGYANVELEYSDSLFQGCSSTLKIYCGATEKPEGWHEYWNCYNSYYKLTNIEWGVTYEQYLEKV